MKLPKNDNDLRDDDRFDDDDHEALFAKSSTNRVYPHESKLNPFINCILTCIVSIQFLWVSRRAEFLLGLILLTSVTLALTGVIETYEMKKHSYSNHQFSNHYDEIKSGLELKLKDIDHWCLDGGDESCPKCDDPTQPISRGEQNGWKRAFMRNTKLAGDFGRRENSGDNVQARAQPDVVFLGDSLVEATVGTLKGYPSTPEGGKHYLAAEKDLDDIKAYYDAKFTKSKGGKYDALRLGIAGDTSPNVFWRIRHNEMRNLTPKVWWLSVGRNDMFRTKCSEEVAIMGVIRVVEALMSKNDGATIVINSLLPTAKKSTLQLEGSYNHNDMWPSIKEVNTRLKKFAGNNHRVVFFDANDIFVEERRSKKFIKKTLYADKSHPNFNGYKELAKAQIVYLDYLMKKRYDSAQSKGTESSAQASKDENAVDGDDGNSAAGEEDNNYSNLYDNDDYFASPYEETDDDDIFRNIILNDDDNDW